MKKVHLLLFLSIFFAFPASAQKSDKKTSDVAILRCYYCFDKKAARTDTAYRTDTLVLDIGNNISRFYDPSRIKRDSLLSATFNNNWSQIKEMNVQTENPPDYSNSPGSASSDLSQGESFQIIKDKGANKLKVLDVMLGIFDKYQYEEDLTAVSWLLDESSTMEILSYPCQKATAKFRGKSIYSLVYSGNTDYKRPVEVYRLARTDFKSGRQREVVFLRTHRIRET